MGAEGDEKLVSRLLAARPADLETLLAAEPRCFEKPFIEGLLGELDDRVELLTVAHEVLRRALDRDTSWLPAYVALASRRMEHAIRTGGDGARVSDILNDLEQTAHQHGDKGIILIARLQRLTVVLARADDSDVMQAAHALVDALDTTGPAPDPGELVRRLSGALAAAAGHAYHAKHDTRATARFAEAACWLFEHGGALRIAAVAGLSRGEYARARHWLARLVERGEAEGADYYHLGECELESGNARAAIAALRSAVALSPENGVYALAAASAMASVGEVEQADRMLHDALPVCERMMRAEPARTWGGPQGVRVQHSEIIAMTRLAIVDAAINGELAAIARRHIEFLLGEGDTVRRAGAQLRLSRLYRMEGNVEAASATFDLLFSEGAGNNNTARLERAAWRIERGECDLAVADLEALVRNGGDVDASVALAQKIRVQVPGHEAARKWMGCALALPSSNEIARGIAILGEVIDAHPDDAYALYRRGVARIAWVPSEPGGHACTHFDVALGVRDLGLAVLAAPAVDEYRRDWLWLIDRIAGDGEGLALILAQRSEPWGVDRVAPGVARALQAIIDAAFFAERKAHQEAISMLADAQQQCAREGLAAMALHCNLDLADNLIRLHELQEALEYLETYDRDYLHMCSRPLTRSLEAMLENQAREGAGSIHSTLNIEFEFMRIQMMGAAASQRTRDMLTAEVQSRLGRNEAALAAVTPIEAELLSMPVPTPGAVSSAVNLAVILRDAGEVGRALAVVEKVRPHAHGHDAFQLDFFKGTSLMLEGDTDAACALFESLLHPGHKLSEAAAGRVQFNLASLYAQGGMPQRAVDLLEPTLATSSLMGRARFFTCLVLAQAWGKLDDRDKACAHANLALASFAQMREALANVADRLSIVGEYEQHIDEALGILVEGQHAHDVFAAVEALRARAFGEQHRQRGLPSTGEVEAVTLRTKKLKRIRQALRRLIRGTQRIGPGYVDANALAELQREDPHVSVFERPADPGQASDPASGRLSVELLGTALTACDQALQRTQGETTRLRAGAAQPAQPAGITPAALGEALQAAAEPGQRCVFVHIVTLGASVVLLRTESDLGVPEIIITRANAGDLAAVARADDIPACLHGASWQGVSQSLPGPLLAGIGAGDVVILCALGMLSRLPWHALAVDGEPWCARNPISYATSATDLVRSLDLPEATGGAVVAGDPHNNLPKARDEARIAAHALGVDPLLGGEATVSAIHASLGGAPPSRIHFACHGSVDPRDSMQSALLLAPVGRTDDGRLTAEALYEATLTGTRAVLSACDTAIGRPSDIEILGLPRSLLVAGARSVVGSLWKADDSAACLLMREFYRQLPSTQGSLALARAQLWLRSCTIFDLVAATEEMVQAEPNDDTRGRLLLDMAGEQVRAGDYGAADLTLRRLLSETSEDAAAPEHARARRYLELLRQRAGLPGELDYTRRPFADAGKWAPFVLMGDWR